MAREMGVAEGLIHNWKKAVKANNTDSENELIELKRKLREVEMERDILKKQPLSLQQKINLAVYSSPRICLRNIPELFCHFLRDQAVFRLIYNNSRRIQLL